jgi:hypothetical protein
MKESFKELSQSSWLAPAPLNILLSKSSSLNIFIEG